ncbi:MAG: ABC transporter ATP-binding protein [Pseudomonadota bacterium]
MSDALVASSVTKRYGDITSVDELSLKVPSGAIVALLGPNGAGKSTTMKMCAGFIAADSGRIIIDGHDIVSDRDAARRAATFLPENVVLYEELSGLENLGHLLAIGTGLRLSEDKLEHALLAAGLQSEAFNRRASTYSKGMRQKVGLALALSRQSALLLLDEPTSGLDPHSAADFNTALRHTASKGVGILMATHDIWRAREVATHVLVMTRGRIVLTLDPANLSAEEIEKRFFLEASA